MGNNNKETNELMRVQNKSVVRIRLSPEATKLCDTLAKASGRNFSQQVEYLIVETEGCEAQSPRKKDANYE